MAASCAQFYRDEVYIRSVLCTTGGGRGNTGNKDVFLAGLSVSAAGSAG